MRAYEPTACSSRKHVHVHVHVHVHEHAHVHVHEHEHAHRVSACACACACACGCGDLCLWWVRLLESEAQLDDRLHRAHLGHRDGLLQLRIR